MDFIDEIKDNLSEIDFSFLSYKFFLFGELGALILNVKNIYKFSDNYLELNIKSNKLIIEGENFSLKSFKKGELYLYGKIIKMEILK